MRKAVLDIKAVTFLFLTEELEALENAFQRAIESTVCEEAVTARLTEFSRLVDALDKSKASYGEKNHAVDLSIVLDVFEHHLTDLQSGWRNEDGTAKHKGQVPLATLSGTYRVPARFACLLRGCCAKMRDEGVVDAADAERTLDVLAEGYLVTEKSVVDRWL
jgi:hypothetical protein